MEWLRRPRRGRYILLTMLLIGLITLVIASGFALNAVPKALEYLGWSAW